MRDVSTQVLENAYCRYHYVRAELFSYIEDVAWVGDEEEGLFVHN